MATSNTPGTDRSPSGSKPPASRMSGRTWVTLLAIMIVIDILFYSVELLGGHGGGTKTVTLSYTQFVGRVRADRVKDAVVQGDGISGTFTRPYRIGKVSYPRYSTTVVSQLLNPTVSAMQSHGVDVTLKSESTPAWLSALGLVLQALPFLLLIGIFAFGARQTAQQAQGVFGVGRSRAKVYTEERPSTTFANVAGVDAAKGELQEIVHFLKDPSVYRRLGAHIPKGVLLVGPPGTGKTLLARAVAGEARVPFFSISATEFVELFVGVGASRVRDLFDQARKAAPAIIFVDEIDAIGGARGGPQIASNDERDQTLNQLLVSMDGFEPNEAVVVLAATNRVDVLDPALLRPGRFDRQVQVDLPDRQGREAILKVHTQEIPLAPDVDLAAVARATPGMSGADLANLANEAALAAARHEHTRVMRADFEEALDRVTLGLEGSPLMNVEERRTVAYHEAGHAIVAYALPNVDPISRITITPRGRSLGVTQLLPMDDRRNYRRDYLVNRMAVGLGGRAAEETVFDDITSGAESDLRFVTNIARTMVTTLGMADDIGPTYFGGSQDATLNGRAYNPYAPKEYSDETGRHIDVAVAQFVAEAHRRAVDVLATRRPELDAVAEALIRDESLDRDQFIAIVEAVQPVPAGSDSSGAAASATAT